MHAFFVIEGTIKPGRQAGSRIGFPTINVSVPSSIKKADWGVYFSLVKVGNTTYPGVTHLGPPKTFKLRRATCETFLLTNRKSFSSKKVKKLLLFRVREVVRFPTVAQLKKQITKDVRAAKKYFDL